MPKSAIITLTTAGTSTGPFNLLSDVDSYVTPFESSILRASLIAGYTTNLVPDAATIIRVKSNGACTNYIDLIYPTPPTTTTTTTTSTTTTTTTAAPTTSTTTSTTTVAYYVWLGPVSTFATSASACSGYNSARSYYSAQNFMVSTVTAFYEESTLTTPINTAGNWLPVALNGVGTIYAVQTNATGSVTTYTSCP